MLAVYFKLSSAALSGFILLPSLYLAANFFLPDTSYISHMLLLFSLRRLRTGRAISIPKLRDDETNVLFRNSLAESRSNQDFCGEKKLSVLLNV